MSDEEKRKKRLSPRAAAENAMEELGDILGVDPYGVVSVERSDGHWEVRVEVIELERIPDSTSVVGEYVVDLDDGAELLAYRRVRTYTRGRTGEG
jgi:hypothetical protein